MTSTAPAKAMNKAEATAITERIRKHIDAAWDNITRAYEGRAWKALGYNTWEAYVRAEFDMTRQRSYQLMDQGRVIHAVAEATGENVKRVGQISARDAAAVKDDLPAVTEEIKAKIEAGEDLAKAVTETVAAKRAEKEEKRKARAAEQEQFDRQRDETLAKLPQAIKDREQAKAEWRARANEGKAAEEAIDRIAELEEAVCVLEAEVEELRAENKLYGDMKVQFAQGGFDKVIEGKDKEIQALKTQVSTESADKVSWMGSARSWEKRARDLGWSNKISIDIETGEIANG
jgi:hypothetical protein